MERRPGLSKRLASLWTDLSPFRRNHALIGRWAAGMTGGMIIATALDAADLLVPLFASAEGEKVVAAHLDGEQRLIAAIEGEGGRHDTVPLPIRQIMGDALRLGSAGIVLAHNHPSGDCAPSLADLDATRAFAAVAASMGVHLHDHLIVGADGECRSLRALGLM